MKRIYEHVSWQIIEDGFEVQLDGRQLKSPAKQPLILPSAALAKRIAQEWESVEETVDPAQCVFASCHCC